MASLIDDLWEAAGAPLHEELNGVTVSYVRGSDTITGLTAIVDVIDNWVESQDEFSGDMTIRDFTIALTGLQINSAQIMPQNHDRIIEGSSTYEVLPLVKGSCFNMLAGEYRVTIHTKQVA